MIKSILATKKSMASPRALLAMGPIEKKASSRLMSVLALLGVGLALLVPTSDAMAGEVPLGMSGRSMRIDWRGFLLPEPSPTGDEELDKRPLQSYVDMYSLAPCYNVDDISIPMDGGELSVQMRRRFSTGVVSFPRTLPNSMIANYSAFTYPTDSVMGAGWKTNLSARLTLSYVIEGNVLNLRATAIDEDGVALRYDTAVTPSGGIKYRPVLWNSMNNESLKAILSPEASSPQVGGGGPGGSLPAAIQLRKAHGTILRYVYHRTFVAQLFTPPLIPVDYYYRLDSITDRNGNCIQYEYGMTNSAQPALSGGVYTAGPQADLLPTRLYDKHKPERSITYSYQHNSEWDEAYNAQGQIRMYQMSIKPDGEILPGPTARAYGNPWRLIRAAAPLGRYREYTYVNGTERARGLLASIRMPPVAVDGSVTPVAPVVTLAYQESIHNAQTVGSLINDPSYINSIYSQYSAHGPAGVDCHVALTAVTDAKGNTISLSYVPEWQIDEVPQGNAAIGTGVYGAIRRPRLSTISTPSGAGGAPHVVAFTSATRTFTRTTTRVVDALGHATTFEFGYQWKPVANYVLGYYAATEAVRRHGTAHVVRFELSGDVNNNIVKVVDMSGVAIQYSYNSLDPQDPYNQPVNPLEPYNEYHNPRRYQLFGKPSSRIIDPGGLNLVTHYRYEPNYNMLSRITDPEGRQTSYTFDSNGNRISISDALNSVTLLEYSDPNFRGELTKTTDPDQRVTTVTRTRDSANHTRYLTITETIVGYSPGQQLNLQQTKITDIVGNIRISRTARGNETTYDYDVLDRKVAETLPAVQLDGPGGPLLTSTALGFYDLNGNAVRQIDHNGNVAIMEYDQRNNAISHRRRMTNSAVNDDVADIITRMSYDPHDRVLRRTDPLGQVHESVYDHLGRLIEQRHPPVGNPPQVAATRYFYEGGNPGSGAWTIGSGWIPTRVINPRGFATDTVNDKAYRQVLRVRRSDIAIPPSQVAATPRAGEPWEATAYNKVGKPVVHTTGSERVISGTLTAANRTVYTYYDSVHRPTLVVQDMNDNGTGLAPGSVINDSFQVALNDLADIVTRKRYDKAGNIIATRDAESGTTDYLFDAAKRLVSETLPSASHYEPGLATPEFNARPVTTFLYEGHLQGAIIDARGTTVKTLFDARDRKTATILDLNGDGLYQLSRPGPDIVTEFFYDSNGNIVRTINPNGAHARTQFDRNDRPIAVIGAAVPILRASGVQQEETQTITTYDKLGNIRTVTDPNGIVSETEYDQWGRKTQVKAARGTPVELITTMRLDQNGNVIALSAANDATSGGIQTTLYAYDAYDRKIAEILPSPDGIQRQTVHQYLISNEMYRTIDAKGQRTEQEHDRAGRLVSLALISNNNVVAEYRSFEYSRLGLKTRITDGSGETVLVYDSLRRLVNERRRNTAASGDDNLWRESINMFDVGGNRTRVLYPQAPHPISIVSRYDRAQRLLRIEDASRSVEFWYDAVGNKAKQVNADRSVAEWQYDAQNRMLAATTREDVANPSSRILLQLLFDYDAAGMRMRMQETIANIGVRTVRYEYDQQYRLTQEQE